MIEKIRQHSLYLGFAIALLGMLGSLYFSEIMGLPPCVLCWYQRIALYPLVVIFAIGIIKKTSDAWAYAIPCIIAGGLVGLYQLMLVYQVIPESSATCSLGVSCATVTWNLLGFINIPLLAFLAFVILAVLYVINRRK